MRAWIAVLLIGAFARPVQAQLAGEIAGGAVVAESAGVAGTLDLSLVQGALFVRGGAQVIGTGASADWENSARVVAATLGVGLIGGASAKHRPYGLIALGSGMDWRESDHFRSIGAAMGTQALRGRIFGELRYERWFQYGPSHVKLPRQAVGVHIGMRFPGSRRTRE